MAIKNNIVCCVKVPLDANLKRSLLKITKTIVSQDEEIIIRPLNE